MERFKKLPPLDMSEWNVTEKEKDTFIPSEWVLPQPWISAFIYTHIKSSFWGYNEFEEEYKDRPKVLQIGCAQGWDAVEIAKVLKLPMINGELHVIDWFKGNLTVDKEEEWSYNEDNPTEWKNHLWSEARKYKVDDIITVFEGDSRKMIHNVMDNWYDLVFIDGGHEYDIVKSDVENGYRKLKKGGIMVFDDFSGDENTYDELNIKDATKEMLEKDTWEFENHGRVHVGVIKAVHEFLEGDYISIPGHHKCYHIKK